MKASTILAALARKPADDWPALWAALRDYISEAAEEAQDEADDLRLLLEPDIRDDPSGVDGRDFAEQNGRACALREVLDRMDALKAPDCDHGHLRPVT